jgi:diguanylate cyclase (GGDEF)-like protein
MVDGSNSPDTATSRHAALRALRDRVLWGMSLLFVLVMALVTFQQVIGGETEGLPLIARLAILATVLPIAMAMLARSIVGPAARLGSMTEQLSSLYSQARVDALLDPITGLGNHRAFQEELHRQIEGASRHQHSLALAIVDLDDLKRVNDERGHVGGDQLLASMGRLLMGATRASDRGFRIGGDEFALLLPYEDADAAHAVMRRLLSKAVAGETSDGRAFSFSCGISAFPSPSAEARHLLPNADAALYWAKRHGRTDVQVFDRERHGDTELRSLQEMAEAVDTVVAKRALTPVFQPIFDIETGRPVGFEGLVRPTEEAGFRDPGSLFSAAEKAERTVELDMLAIAIIAEGISDDLGDAYLSVNVSPRTLETDQFRVGALVALVGDRGLTPDRMVLELTEREAIEDMDRLRVNLESCRAAGFRIAADDVGAGNAGLRLLSEINFDVVKIDLSLVRGGVLRDSAVTVLRAIQEIAARSKASVVAEGIETLEQLDVIRRLTIASGQGFLLAAPGPQASASVLDIEELVESHRARRAAMLNGWDPAETLA